MKNLYILIAIFSFLFPLTAQATVAGDVEHLRGEVWIERGGERISLHNGDTVDAGDVVVTAQSGRVKLHMQDGSKVFVGRESRITIDRYETQKGILSTGSFNMLWGKVRFLVAKLSEGASSFSVRTKTATIGVRGTQFAVMVNRPLTPKQIVPTTVMLFEGAVVGKSIRGNLTNIKPGKLVLFNPAGKITTRNISKRDLKKLDIKPLEFTKAPTASNKPEAKPTATAKPFKGDKPDAKPESRQSAKPVEGTKPELKPEGGKSVKRTNLVAPVMPEAKGDLRTGPEIKPTVKTPEPTKSGAFAAPAVGGKGSVGGRVVTPSPKVAAPAPRVAAPAPRVSVPAPRVAAPALPGKVAPSFTPPALPGKVAPSFTPPALPGKVAPSFTPPPKIIPPVPRVSPPVNPNISRTIGSSIKAIKRP